MKQRSSRNVLILRNTFRLHDNAALHKAINTSVENIILLVDKTRVQSPIKSIPAMDSSQSHIIQPHFNTWKSLNKYAYGYHQYYFMLHALRTFQDDLKRYFPKIHVCIICTNPVAFAEQVASAYTHCICDNVDDPAWSTFDIALHTHFSSRLQIVNTQTLLDWTCEPHKTFLNKWGVKRHNQSFKDYVYQQMIHVTQENVHAHDCNDCKPQSNNNTRQTRSVSVSPSNKSAKHNSRSPRRSRSLPRTRTRTRTRSHSPSFKHRHGGVSYHALIRHPFKIEHEIKVWRNHMTKCHVTPFEPPQGCSCEEWALEQLQSHVLDGMPSPQWQKPKTYSIFDIHNYGTDPLHTTSKLSPFFAIGVLSCKYAYDRWKGSSDSNHESNSKKATSAIAQLLWREEFHACSHLKGYWATRDSDKKGTPSASSTQKSKTQTKHDTNAQTQRFWKRDMEWNITRGDDKRFSPLLHAIVSNKHDLNSSIIMLARDGWIHHLRRHIIADFVTRGGLKADWMLGETYFRHMLLDHDACINRGNWMWLSASDFSPAFLMRHYNHDTYVRRQSNAMSSHTKKTQIT